MSDEDLTGLDLIQLNAYYNPRIKKVNQFKNLKILNCGGICGITDNDLVGLDLIELRTCSNNKIKNIQHLKNLKYLDCSEKDSVISDQDLIGLDLIELNTYDNPYITKINHMENLKILVTGGNCGITQDSINMDKYELFIFTNKNFNLTINPLKNIRVLNSIYYDTKIYLKKNLIM